MSNHCKSLPSNIKPLVSAIAAILVLNITPVHATIYTVSNSDNWGLNSLREAIEKANANAGNDTINFASGLDGQTILLTTGQIDITDAAGTLLIDASALTNGITISGNHTSRIFGETEGQKLTLNNLTVTAGRTTVGTTFNTIDCSTLATNPYTTNTFGNGGAICAEGGIELIDSTISNSRTSGGDASGGGFWTGDATLINSTISGNSTLTYYSYGGGFAAYGDLTLTNSTVSGNSTTGDKSQGGGFFAQNGRITLTNSTISGNETAGYKSYGGGFSVDDGYGAVTLTNSTVSANSAAGRKAYGGGISALDSAVELFNSTVTQNVASYATDLGGGIASAAVVLESSILSGNGTDNVRGTVYAYNSLFGDPVGELTTNTDNVFNNSPGLAPLADNGCATPAGASATSACVQTHALLVSSPALDKGANHYSLATDQRGAGFPRTINSQTDIGAFEGVAPPPALAFPPSPIPTMSTWGLGILASLLGLIGFVRRRKA